MVLDMGNISENTLNMTAVMDLAFLDSCGGKDFRRIVVL